MYNTLVLCCHLVHIPQDKSYTVHLFFHYSGCGHCWSMDGNWKLCFPYCMFPVSSSVPNLPNVWFPNVCPEPLKPKSAFCIEHYSKAQTLGYPTDVKGFLSYCGAAKTAGISLLFCFEDYGLYPAKRDSKISCP